MMSKGLQGTDKRGIRELGGEKKVGWDEVSQGVVLHSFDTKIEPIRACSASILQGICFWEFWIISRGLLAIIIF